MEQHTLISDAEITSLGKERVLVATWAQGEAWLDSRGGHISGSFHDGGITREGVYLPAATTPNIHKRLRNWLPSLPGVCEVPPPPRRGVLQSAHLVRELDTNGNITS